MHPHCIAFLFYADILLSDVMKKQTSKINCRRSNRAPYHKGSNNNFALLNITKDLGSGKQNTNRFESQKHHGCSKNILQLSEERNIFNR